MCRFAAGCGAPPPRCTKSAAGGSARRFAAEGNSGAAETRVYSAVGRMAARAAARADGSKFRRSCAAAGGLSSPRRRSLGLDGFSCRENHLVAPLVLVCLERVVPPTPGRIIFTLRYTDKLRDEYSGDQCVPRERFGGDCLRRPADRRGRGGSLTPPSLRRGISRAGDPLLPEGSRPHTFRHRPCCGPAKSVRPAGHKTILRAAHAFFRA